MAEQRFHAVRPLNTRVSESLPVEEGLTWDDIPFQIVQPAATATQEGGAHTVTQEGGKYLARGAYGCVFTPPLLCRGQSKLKPSDGKLAGKIGLPSSLQQELRVGEYFKGVPKAMDYMLLPDPDSLCIPKPMEQQTDLGVFSCKIAVKTGAEKMRMFKMPLGGQNLRSFLNKFESLSSKFKFETFFEQILELGAFMVLHGFVHNDLHSENILLDASYRPRTIDYGRSYFVKQIGKERVSDLGARFEPDLNQVAPEVSTMDGVDGKKPLPYIFEQLRTKREDLRALEQILGISREAQVAELRRFWAQSRVARQKDWVGLYKLYWPVVDAWALGHILLKILHMRLLPLRSFRESPFWQQKGSVIKRVLRGLQRMSPRERMDAVEALELWDPTHPMVSKGAGAEWLRKRRVQRQQVRASLVAMRGGGGGGSEEGEAMPDDDEDLDALLSFS